ncbi:MAG: aldehyde dehydrogenase family protein [SAR86 cluster bacterium]|uniref:aldehyde dehydrogenase (NAD(+)) n=1 Tax=SAR86 cluster bacterium TaxID=2030880 RepID=A0A2A5B3N6_9GAMM|nr:MAG: aldehyde dehydrogenase family protein [SAR86 cluster bacterium]
MSQNAIEILESLGISKNFKIGDMAVRSPIDGLEMARVRSHSNDEIDAMIANAQKAFLEWRKVPAPKRGQLIRILGEKLRTHKAALGRLVTMECGKIYQEGLGEVQEMIDICDFAVGLSRQLYGLTIASERPGHKMVENWHPIGSVGIISAFNFPVAVWAWNTALALVCGDSVIWKPSEKTPLTALACQAILQEALDGFSEAPENLSQILLGNAVAGQKMVEDKRMAVISATGSCAMGRKVAPIVAARFGRSILELGGNNAIIVCPSADLKMALHGIVFGAVGTAGQRCTSTRRLFLHEDIYDTVVASIKDAYGKVSIGDPLNDDTLVGPLIDAMAFSNMEKALALALEQGASVTGGKRIELDKYTDAYYVKPAVVEMPSNIKNVKEETFAPILYIFKYNNLETAILANNDVPQGLSSAIFTNNVREAELFTSALGSDCGIANVNIGTSGAEIGGAFGGEKETGGGRESGSDAWKGYMRRSTSTLNYSSELPLAQGIKFDLGD